MPTFSPTPTPLLRLGPVLAKLESLRASGTTEDRGLAQWDAYHLLMTGEKVAALTSGAAIAGAGWARAHRLELRAVVYGPLTHEAAEALKLWGARVERAESKSAAKRLAMALADAQQLPPLDEAGAVEAARASLGVELRAQLEEAGANPTALIGPSGCLASLLGAHAELRARWPKLRVLALHAAPGEEPLPELPSRDDGLANLLAALDPSARFYPERAAPEIEWVAVTRAAAQEARKKLAREHGLCASHAAAASVAHALTLGAAAVALLSSTGEREFSLDPPAVAPAISAARASP